jgi:cell wall-associated NlpC family hydrolase
MNSRLIASAFAKIAMVALGLTLFSESAHAQARPYLHYNGRYAAAPPGLPIAVARAVAAANELQGKPYRWGGGHRYLNDRGYDCSGSVSYVLHKAGLLRGPLTSKGFRSYGAPGPGRFITLYVSGDHVFISICGLRFDTSDYGSNRGDGPKWRPTARKFPGFQVRHIPGL